ncbi:MAG: hypothetical protein RL557_543 [archaeon]|jgi:prefoldin alpha subunit
MKQEYISQVQRVEQELNALNQQFQLIENNLHELQSLYESLRELEKKESKEMLVNIGKQIFLPVSLRESACIVDVGKNNLVKKSIPETKKIVEEQLKKLQEGKNAVMERIETLDTTMEQLVQEIENEEKNK